MKQSIEAPPKLTSGPWLAPIKPNGPDSWVKSRFPKTINYPAINPYNERKENLVVRRVIEYLDKVNLRAKVKAISFKKDGEEEGLIYGRLFFDGHYEESSQALITGDGFTLRLARKIAKRLSMNLFEQGV
jgi:hypothetical protein